MEAKVSSILRKTAIPIVRSWADYTCSSKGFSVFLASLVSLVVLFRVPEVWLDAPDVQAETLLVEDSLRLCRMCEDS